jgi:tryptophan-associated transmembrane protein
MSGSRRLAVVVLACLAGAALVLFGATRTWSLEVVVRPGLPELRTARTGAADLPLLVGLALVALAGAGALPATRGPVRRVLGGLLALIGAALATGAVAGRAGLDPGRAGAGATVWPAACVLGGAMIVAGGVAAARHGHRWPGMGTRYERGTVPPPPADVRAGTGPLAAAGLNRAEAGPDRAAGLDRAAGPDRAAATESDRLAAGADRSGCDAGVVDREDRSDPHSAATSRSGGAPLDTRAVWDALDRGDDPTLR